jgi:PilX N-terminal
VSGRSQSGIALIVAIMATLVVSALGVALILGSTSDTLMAANFSRSLEARYAAEAALERGAADAQAAADWTGVLTGLVPSTFVDGPPGGTRPLPDGTRLDLAGVVNLANCDRPSRCEESELASTTAERPWGPNNPRWQLYAYGPLTQLLPPGTALSSFYLVLLVGDDPAENDDQPLVDGGPPVTGEAENAGRNMLVLRAEAFGPRGAHARIDATLDRLGGLVSWRLVR